MILHQRNYHIHQLSEIGYCQDPGANIIRTKIQQTLEKEVYDRIKEVTGKTKKYKEAHIVITDWDTSTIIRKHDKITQRFRYHNFRRFVQASRSLLSQTNNQNVSNIEQFSQIDFHSG